MLNQIENILVRFKQNLVRNYGVATCKLEVTQITDQKYLLKGVMLNSKQQSVLEKELTGFAGKLQWQIDLLTDVYPLLGFGYTETIPVNIWSRTLLEDQPKFLTSQIVVKDEPLKLLWETDEFFCVQQIDQTIGWVRKKFIQKFPGLPQWQPQPQKATNKQDFLAYIHRWLGVPYLLGGLTMQGIDCSGLVQNIYRHQFNYLLPRHSMDQMAAGKNSNYPKVGDLVFFDFFHSTSQKKTSHVGIIINTEAKKIAHASLEMGKKVEINSLEEILSSGYKLLGYRTYPVEIF